MRGEPTIARADLGIEPGKKIDRIGNPVGGALRVPW
jgi:hypothetical protein